MGAYRLYTDYMSNTETKTRHILSQQSLQEINFLDENKLNS